MNIHTLRYQGAHSLFAIVRSVVPLLSLQGDHQMTGDEAISKRVYSLDWKQLATLGVVPLCSQLRLPRLRLAMTGSERLAMTGSEGLGMTKERPRFR